MACAALAVWMLLPVVLEAQRPREQLIAQAFNEFDPDRRTDVLVMAADPRLGRLDSVWGFGVQMLVQALLDQHQDTLAAVWARWAVRHSPRIRIDTLQFLPVLFSTFHSARAFVGEADSTTETVTQTAWTWRAPGMTEAVGRLHVRSVNPGITRVRIAGVGPVDPGGHVRLDPGSYYIEATAEGFETLRVVREVLPGVTTVIAFAMRPAPAVLSEKVKAAAVRKLVRLTVSRFGTKPTCGTGFFVGSDGMLLTTYWVIRGADSLEAQLPDGQRITDLITVAAYDLNTNVAVLHLPIQPTDSLVLRGEETNDEFAWVLGYPDCESVAAKRVRVTASKDRPHRIFRLIEPLPMGGQGGPMINQSGAVIGLTTGTLSAVPVGDALGRLIEANRNAHQQRLLTPAEVSLRERHRYGSVRISAGVPDAVARITPLEPWQWAEISTMGPLPLTFTGPMGRYQLQIIVNGQVRHEAAFTVTARLLDRLVVP
jgi:hypothetical protein